jgi:hypothetical protein
MIDLGRDDMNDDDARRPIELASQRERDALDEWIERVLKVFGHEGALVTAESLVSDSLEFGGAPYRFRRGRSGPWSEAPGDPVVRERNDRFLASVSAELGVPLGPEDLLVDVARRLRKCGRA